MDLKNPTTIEPIAAAQRGRRLAAFLCPPGQGLYLEPTASGAPNRMLLEEYVRDAFRAKHGATLGSLMPTLVAFRDRHGSLRGVAGLRGAHEDRLFLEQYLDRPIERVLADALCETGQADTAGVAIRRSDIVEVGNLAGASCRAAVRIVAQLPAYLMTRRYRWIVFTATSALRDILAGFGAPLVELARADAASVGEQRDEWGRYYETDPRVCAGFLPDADQLACFAHRGGSH